MGYWHDGMSGWGYGFMTISMVLFWALLILAGIALVRYLNRPEQGSGGHLRARPTAEDLLAERFARGEIDTEEYRQRLAVLHGGTSPGSGG